ncbi:MAG: ubiquitin-like protein Pup [Propionibacterium sp.]|nr:ubiquitin-like protein Pup [Propionibacterium sp.]
MSEQVQRQPSQPPTPAASEQETRRATSASASGFDDLLDSIDAVLETNAEEYVRSFVQKGGQ